MIELINDDSDQKNQMIIIPQSKEGNYSGYGTIVSIFLNKNYELGRIETSFEPTWKLTLEVLEDCSLGILRVFLSTERVILTDRFKSVLCKKLFPEKTIKN